MLLTIDFKKFSLPSLKKHIANKAIVKIFAITEISTGKKFEIINEQLVTPPLTILLEILY